MLLFVLLSQALDRSVCPYSRPGTRFLKSTPQRDIVFDRIHVVPVDQAVDRGIVDFVIDYCTSPILNRIFDGCNYHDDDQGDRVEGRSIDTEN